MNSGYFGLPRLLSLLLQRNLRLLPQFPLIVPWPASSQVSKVKKWKSLSRVWRHLVTQARILGWVAVPFSRVSSHPRDWTQVSCIEGRFYRLSHQGDFYSPYLFSVFWRICPFLPEVQWLESSVFKEFCLFFCVRPESESGFLLLHFGWKRRLISSLKENILYIKKKISKSRFQKPQKWCIKIYAKRLLKKLSV